VRFADTLAQVQRCNLIPRHIDVGWPDFPTHDPNYRREDLPVAALLDAEMAAQPDTWECPDRTDLDALIAAEPANPWVTAPSHPQAVRIAMRMRWESVTAPKTTPKGGRRKAKAEEVFNGSPPSPAEEDAS